MINQNLMPRVACEASFYIKNMGQAKTWVRRDFCCDAEFSDTDISRFAD